MKLCEKIRLLRTTYNMTQKELGHKINVSVVSVGCWENGSKSPSIDAIVSMSKIFGVSTDYLLGVVIDPQIDAMLLSQSEKTLLSNYRTLDFHGRRAVDTLCAIEKSRVNAEKEKDSGKHYNTIPPKVHSARYIPRYTTPSAAGLSIPLDGDDFNMILVDETVPYEADFAVGIQGDSMYPHIKDGDTVYVKKVTSLSNGDIGIFCVDGAMYCKQYYLDENKNLILVSANPDLRHTNISVSSESGMDVRCYGKVLLDHNIELPDYIYD